MKQAQEKNSAGCCGLYCGLCPRYQSTAKSRCPGCKILSLTISCKIYNCCVKKSGFVTCAQCTDFPCDKYENFFDWDSFISRKVCLPNIERIKGVGLNKWLGEQSKRRQTLENLLTNYNEGRSCSFYCIATALMPFELVKKAIDEATKMSADNKMAADIKAKAKIMRATIQDFASKAGIDLKLRRKPK
jgi:hypothetical protein